MIIAKKPGVALDRERSEVLERLLSEVALPERFIWPYLRGAEEFTWSGMFCRIQPSPYDLRKAREYQLVAQKCAQKN